MNDQTQATFDLRHYLQVLWRRKFLIIAVLIVVPAIVLVLSLSQAPVYKATARVMVESQQPALSVVAPQSGSGGVDTRDLATLADFVANREVAAAVQRELGWAATADDLSAAIETVPNTDANIIDITASQPTADKAATLANAFAVQFVAWRQKTQQAAVEAAIAVTNKQIASTTPGTPDYQALVSQRNQLETVKALSSGGVTIGEKATPPSAPASPKPLRNTVLAAAAALLLGIALAFVRDALDIKLHTLDDLQRATDLPIITTIDQLPREFRRNGKLIALEDPRSPVAESYRVLRTNLEFMNFNRDLKAVLVTSPLPGQGKSTTIANLAVVLLKSGKRVAVVEGDLRRPTMHSYFSVPNDVGLSSVIAGIVPLDEAIRVLTLRDSAQAITVPTPVRQPAPTGAGTAGTKTAVTSRRETLASSDDGGAAALQLRLLTSGPLPPNPGEIATSQQLSDVIDRLKRDNDYVLIDAPPMLAVGDAAAIAGKVDGVIVMIRVEDTTRNQIAEVERFLERVPARALGLVAAGVSKTDRKTYAHYHEYY